MPSVSNSSLLGEEEGWSRPTLPIRIWKAANKATPGQGSEGSTGGGRSQQRRSVRAQFPHRGGYNGSGTRSGGFRHQGHGQVEE